MTTILDPTGTYRYVLSRHWNDNKAPLVFVMLNPSTADATRDDPTIRKCIGFAKRYDYGGIRVVNLYAYRATDPKALWRARLGGVDIVGPGNDEHIAQLLADEGCPTVVAAWGANAKDAERIRRMLVLLRGLGIAPLCLGRTNDGRPRHPLMLPYEARIVSFEATL